MYGDGIVKERILYRMARTRILHNDPFRSSKEHVNGIVFIFSYIFYQQRGVSLVAKVKADD